MVVYHVGGTEFTVDTTFLEVAKQEQAKEIRGVYGWYILPKDLIRLGLQSRTDQPTYLYIGTVTDKRLKSVTSRFLGELCGAQVCTDKEGKKFDTDFAMSCVITFLCEKGVDVYFHLLCEKCGQSYEVGIARNVKPVLQRVTPKTVRLHPSIRKEITLTADDIKNVGAAVIERLAAHPNIVRVAVAAASTPRPG
ncbi:MAG: hypothetical protein DMG97_20335 [Acidobacteria bacterium]|nr:MAG: hypothetical protein DMG97_20335 [Acidobacteriota bacterium]